MLDGVDDVYHLAAAVGVRLIAESPIHTIETNVYPMELLLDELGRLQAAGRTVALVPGQQQRSLRQESQAGLARRRRHGFRAHHAAALVLRHVEGDRRVPRPGLWRERQLPTVVGRFFNVVGPRQTGAYGMVLPRLVDAALGGGPLVVHDDGRQERCFAHVGDVIRAVLALMESPLAVGRVLNIGSDRPVSILELAQRVIRAVDPALRIEFISYAAAYGQISKTAAAACPISRGCGKRSAPGPAARWRRRLRKWWRGNGAYKQAEVGNEALGEIVRGGGRMRRCLVPPNCRINSAGASFRKQKTRSDYKGGKELRSVKPQKGKTGKRLDLASV